MRLLVVGGAMVDFVVRPTSTVVRDTSNEGEILLGAGGAGRNVAENLQRLGCQVTLVTDLAADFLGRFLLDNLHGLGIETRLAQRERTGLYLALLHPDGSLEKGFCHTGTEHVAASEILAVLPDLATFEGAVLDANLNQETLTALAAACRAAGVPYALETVANEKARRVLPALDGCFLIKPDRAEARMLTGLPCDTVAEGAACARRLCELGAQAALVSLGRDGFCFDNGTFAARLAAAPTVVVDVTGAGDALFSTALAGLLMGLAPQDVLEAAGRAAALACACVSAVSPGLSPSLFQHLRSPA